VEVSGGVEVEWRITEGGVSRALARWECVTRRMGWKERKGDGRLGGDWKRWAEDAEMR